MRTIMMSIPILTLSNSLRISMKEGVTKAEVSDFKNKWCNENQLIIEIIRKEIYDYFNAPILDVGSGLGDIAFHVLANKEVIQVDINKITKNDYPLSNKHHRIHIDFFEYTPIQKINTVFISHTLQFLDEDVMILNDKIQEIDPENIILVLNKNNDLLGDLIEWSEQNFINPNPEVDILGFPYGYKLNKFIDFQAFLKCDSFKDLAIQISYLLLIDLNEITEQSLIQFLKSKLMSSEFKFNQVIKIYSKDGTK